MPNDLITIEKDVDHRTEVRDDLLSDIADYYDQSYWDYRTSWLNSKNLAIHYGYWSDKTQSHSDSLIEMNKVLADQLDLKPGDHVLDAGCGIGGSSIWLAEHYGVKVTGITISPTQIEQANKNAKKRGVDHLVTFKLQDYTHTSFADETFDHVWGLESICYALKKSDFVTEAFRVLKKGGCFAVADGFANKRELTKVEWKHVLKVLNGWSMPNMSMPSEFESFMKDSGFSDIYYRDITNNTLPSSKRLYYTALLTYPMEKIMSWLRLRTSVQSGNFNACFGQYHVLHDGIGCYGLFSARKSA
ncbi:MAG TPA: methyltransferase domain-containing protein [Cycloclasticus sp.]|jgi:cyclopropane fatty-acyl-phospholipid synthase-like methyltransferase|nr:methyltransferase domain-containing protein [Cycloclasticus sp.]HIL92722.1 methyltransferase domain-containing protein [Cycloclasticus sp.]